MIHYTGNVTYQKDTKFIPNSYSNISRMNVLEDNGEYVFLVKGNRGFVFDHDDVQRSKGGDDILPVMVVLLRDTPTGYKQAHGLRIRESYAGAHLATTWYKNYIDKVEPIVSDREHLEGGYQLWKGFIRYVSKNKSYQIKKLDLETNEVLEDDVDVSTPEETIWSEYPDTTKKNIVLVFGKRGF